MFLYWFEVDGFYEILIMVILYEENVMVNGLFYVLKSLKYYGVVYVGILFVMIVYFFR